MINLNSPDIMDAREASKIWGYAENYVRRAYLENPKKFPKGSIRKFGKQWIVTTEGMEAITGKKDPRKLKPVAELEEAIAQADRGEFAGEFNSLKDFNKSFDKFIKQDIATYPVILTEYNDESGHYYVVTSPNIQGMVTDGETIPEALENAKDALATMLANEPELPEVQDSREWSLDERQQTSWVSVNMTRWLNKYGKTVRRNISIPADLNEWAKRNKINVSKVATDALYDMQEA